MLQHSTLIFPSLMNAHNSFAASIPKLLYSKGTKVSVQFVSKQLIRAHKLQLTC